MDEQSLNSDDYYAERFHTDEEIININLLSTRVERMELDFQLGNSDKRNLKRHNKLYTKILKQYVNNFRETSRIKKKYKKGIIDILLIMMIGIPIVVFVFLYYLMENFPGQDNLPALVSGSLTAIVSLVTAFVAIPKIIIGYLFNEKEEENMTAIIKNIQDYDKQIRLNKASQNEEDKNKDVS